jgi:N-acetylmuramoyl-L-alanine amidase
VVAAFQRHFRPARVDGIADASTVLTLRALMETRPKPLG